MRSAKSRNELAHEFAIKSTKLDTYAQHWYYYIFGVLVVALGLYTGISMLTSPWPVLPELPEIRSKIIPWIFLALVVEVIFINGFLKTEPVRLNSSINSVFMNVFEVAVSIFRSGVGLYPYAYLNERYCLLDWDKREPGIVSWIAMFFLVELCYYWFHRFAHEWNFMWAAHVVHHNSEDYTLSTALRQGALQGFTSWMWYLPLAFFFPVPLYFVHYEINILYQFWIHTECIDKLPWPIEFIFNTPSHHRVHHGRNAQYIDKNYGGTLIIYDRMFGTFEPEKERVRYGITHELNTWDPFYSQFHHWIEIAHVAYNTPGIINKLRTFLDYGPGYNYFFMHYEDFQKPSEQEKQPQRIKYDSSVIGFAMTTYLVLHLITLVGLALYFFVERGKMDFLMSFCYASFLVYNIFTFSAFFDGKTWVKLAEVIRLILCVCFTLHIMMYNGFIKQQISTLDDIFSLMVQREGLALLAYFSISLLSLISIPLSKSSREKKA